MKINARLLLITFIIVLILSVSYTLIYYSLATNILRSQQSKTLQLSKSSLIYNFTELQSEASQDFSKLAENLSDLSNDDLNNGKCDFIFEVTSEGLINRNNFVLNNKVNNLTKFFTLDNFLQKNPTAIISSYSDNENKLFFYGRIVTPEIIDEIVSKNKAEIVLYKNNQAQIVSNEKINEVYLNKITDAIEIIKKEDLNEYYFETDAGDLFLTYFDLFTDINYLPKNGIVVFSIATELAEFQESMKYLMLVLIISGIVLTIIMVLIFTNRIRRQITYLSYGAEIVSKGNLDHRVTIVSNDEIGKLGEAFNHMLREIQHRDQLAREYSEFTALINQNPSVKEMSEVSIEKIINITGFSIGAIHQVEDKHLILLSSYGIDEDSNYRESSFSFFSSVIKKKERKEIYFEDNHPEIQSGIIKLKIASLFIVPIIYNNNVIAVLELATEKPNFLYSKFNLDSVIEQLAIGLTNAIAFEKLELMVSELKILNDNYQKQNEQIVLQNQQLKELHDRLSENAEELELEKEKAVSSTKVKSQFLANMSHELRTPLNSILGLTELIKKNSSTMPATKEKLDVVLRNGKKLLLLINNILEFSKAESETFKVKREIFSLNKMVEDIKDYIIPQITEKNLEYEFNNVNKLHYILNSAPEMIEQILMNLLGNAVKFTNFGFIKLSVQKIADKDLQFIVEDSGVGISKEEQGLIFEEFNKASNSVKTNKGGSGLGLAICKRYVQLLKGEIELESAPKKGSKFIVTLPGIIKNCEDISVAEISKNSETAYIITQNDNAFDLYKKYLNANAIELIQLDLNSADKNKPVENGKLILIDISSVSESWSLLLQIKNNKKLQHIPLFMFSADFESHLGYLLNPFDYITNINNPEILLNVVSNAEKKLNKKTEKVCFVNEESLAISDLSDLMEKEKIDMSLRDSSEILPEKVLIDKPDLIFIDLINENFSGIEILTRLKNSKETQNIPVVFYTTDFAVKQFGTLLNESIETIAKINNYHPLDTLNILRKTLNFSVTTEIEENFPTLNSQLIIENDIQNKNKISGKSILVVDDDKDTQYTVGEILKESGFNVIFAGNGLECLSELNKNSVDLVLLDIMMPKMDGFETIKNIRKNSSLRGLKVIALTAYAMLDNKEVIEKNGFDDIITKPIITNTLLEKINDTVGRRIS